MSTLRTNALEGVDAKNSITIVAGAGNITTTNVQEGMVKTWASIKGTTSTELLDSFNVASVSDDATGKSTITITNDMASGNFSLTGNLSASQVGDEYTLSFLSTDTSAGSRRIFSSTNYEPGSANGSARDNIANVVFHGDLA